MDDICSNVIQKPDKGSAHIFDTTVTNGPPGVVANDQTSHPLLSEEIVLKPLYGLAIQL